MKKRGRPFLGAISGLILGLTVGLDLVMFKVVAFGATSIMILPAAGLLLGIVMGVASPFSRSKGAPVPAMPVMSHPASPPPMSTPPPAGYSGPGGGPTGPSEPPL